MFSQTFKRGAAIACRSCVNVRRHLRFPLVTFSKVEILSRVPTISNVSCWRILCTWPNEKFPPPTEWGYKKYDGPSTWPEKYPPARGHHQSPIDIKTEEVIPAPELKDKPLTWTYPSQICRSIVNSGCGWRVDISSSDDNLCDLMGGPLEHNYKFVQFHSHWGNNTECGSEHTIDGKKFAGELHFVHWNTDSFSKCAEAVSATTGLCVLGVLLEVGEPNSEMEKLCEAIRTIPYKDQRCDLPPDFDPSYLFPVNQSYWTYSGSLTTPPCYESVTWIVFKHSITISKEQLECFRGMHNYCEDNNPSEGSCHGLVQLNFRPPQDLNDRVIRECSFS